MSEGRVPERDIYPWVRWDGGLDSARNSSAAAAVVVAVTKNEVIWQKPNPFDSDT